MRNAATRGSPTAANPMGPCRPGYLGFAKTQIDFHATSAGLAAA